MKDCFDCSANWSRCEECEEVGIELYNCSNPMYNKEFAEAWEEFVIVFAEALKLDIILGWLNNKLIKIDKFIRKQKDKMCK